MIEALKKTWYDVLDPIWPIAALRKVTLDDSPTQRNPELTCALKVMPIRG